MSKSNNKYSHRSNHCVNRTDKQHPDDIREQYSAHNYSINYN